MEPWLDSLSEDWKSEPHSSSSPPQSIASGASGPLHRSVPRSRSQSKIPHLAHSLRKSSSASTGSFLRHRSTRGQAQAQAHAPGRAPGEPILRERSASRLNLPSLSRSDKFASLHSHASSVLSESQNSVQHHSVRDAPTQAETPEWKRRLASADDVAIDGFDLFSPSKLEGVFKNRTTSHLPGDTEPEQAELGSAAKRPFTLPTSHAFSDPYNSYRPPRARPNLDVVEEINEEDEAERKSAAVLSDSPSTRPSPGLVRHRVQSLERRRPADSSAASSPALGRRDGSRQPHDFHDPRWRTLSGQEELKNEDISPVTVSKQNSIRATVLETAHRLDTHDLRTKLERAASSDADRPVSSSSDRDVSYGPKAPSHETVPDEPLPDLTSQSLPDDLSMGTQEFVSHGGFVNSRRGGRSNEASFLRRSLSMAHDDSRLEPSSNGDLQMHSSPPPDSRHGHHDFDFSKISASAPATPQDSSVVHHDATRPPLTPSQSPLKLFGNRDTYTNNKLMRILSQFEDRDDRDDSVAVGEEPRLPEQGPDAGFRMSQFGQGELDGYGFDQAVPRPPPIDAASLDPDDRIFPHVAVATAVGGADDPKDRRQPPGMPGVDGGGEDDGARNLSSARNRTTKRQKTRFTAVVAGQHDEVDPLAHAYDDHVVVLAGQKRKDARPGEHDTQADPETLATRTMLKPKTARNQPPSAGVDDLTDSFSVPRSDDLTEALAAELAHFAEEAAQVQDESRKPSLATKDYMEEANKVMQFIRNRGKPKTPLPDIVEPGSELNPDAILDLELDGDSTKDDFSRPPSREGPVRLRPDRRHARHDSRTASYLRKYQDPDDLEALESAWEFEAQGPANNTLAVEAAQIPVPGDAQEQESSPPNMRIANPPETVRKRKHSTSSAGGSLDATRHPPAPQSSLSSTQRTYPTTTTTTTSSSAGQKGIIASGTVSIPDRVGVMTFDHSKKMWVKKMPVAPESTSPDRHERHTFADEDPFEDIPDLSVDELRELRQQAPPMRHRRSEPTVDEPPAHPEVDRPSTWSPRACTVAADPQMSPNDGKVEKRRVEDDHGDQNTQRSKASEHEANLHNGIASQPPAHMSPTQRQARVVTIAFSSPLVSAVNYANVSDADLDDLPREEDLPLDDADVDLDENAHEHDREHDHGPGRGLAFQPRTISPIQESDEEPAAGQLSLVQIKQTTALTPAAPRTVARIPRTGHRASSILCLTPLSDFSVHQVDGGKHADQSYVEDRKHPNALRQAHGSLALAVDELVKAITDAVPEELFWEQLGRITFASGSLASVHGLNEYCPALEEVGVGDNRLSQLGGLPTSIRVLDIRNNLLNDLTSWVHLHNLQYVDVSGNQLDSLEGFATLVHLRALKANQNRIASIDGILNLDGLLELELHGNQLRAVNFAGADLPRLRRLDLSHNQLDAVQGLEHLGQLEQLDLSHNALRRFEPGGDVGTLGVRELRLSHNQLEVLALGHLPVVRHLHLDHNSIRDVAGLSAAYHLELLSLREQRDSPQIVERILSTPNECRQIRLSSNPVRNGTFQIAAVAQNSLRELELAACGIAELPGGFGTCFPNCRDLNLNFNAVKDVGPLRRMTQLRRLLLAKNRIGRLRRTCVVLSRLASLRQVDLRDNPLTVGFYSPVTSAAWPDPPGAAEGRYCLPVRCASDDGDWIPFLDEVTGLRRRMIELLLADHCPQLVELDGLALCAQQVQAKDDVWSKLTDQGVLQKAAGLVPSVSTSMLVEPGSGIGDGDGVGA